MCNVNMNTFSKVFLLYLKLGENVKIFPVYPG